MNKMTKAQIQFWSLIAGISLLVIAIIFMPLAVVWALNTLFPVLAIPYNFWSWLAVIVINLTWMYKPSVSLKG
jgi:hypothetical protein